MVAEQNAALPTKRDAKEKKRKKIKKNQWCVSRVLFLAKICGAKNEKTKKSSHFSPGRRGGAAAGLRVQGAGARASALRAGVHPCNKPDIACFCSFGP